MGIEDGKCSEGRIKREWELYKSVKSERLRIYPEITWAERVIKDVCILIQSWPSGKLPYDCQKIAKNLTFEKKNCQRLAIFLKRWKFWAIFFWKKRQVFGNFLTVKWQFPGGSGHILSSSSSFWRCSTSDQPMSLTIQLLSFISPRPSNFHPNTKYSNNLSNYIFFSTLWYWDIPSIIGLMLSMFFFLSLACFNFMIGFIYKCPIKKTKKVG